MIYRGNHLSSTKGFLAMGKAATKLGGDTFSFFTKHLFWLYTFYSLVEKWISTVDKVDNFVNNLFYLHFFHLFLCE